MARLNTRPSYRTSTAPSSRYASATPVPGNTSDQENHDPTKRMDKGKGRARDSIPSRTSLPTPESGGSGDARGQKRKRTESRADDEHGGDEEEEEEEDVEAKFNKYFDPNQDPEERRDLKKKSRALERGFAGKLAKETCNCDSMLIDMNRNTR